MEDYIRKGVSSHSDMASPIAVQPIYNSRGQVIQSPPQLDRAQVEELERSREKLPVTGRAVN